MPISLYGILGNTTFITPSNLGQRVWSQSGIPILLTCSLLSSFVMMPENTASREVRVMSDSVTSLVPVPEVSSASSSELLASAVPGCSSNKCSHQ